MKNIVIVGAGFGGLKTALELEKKVRGQDDVSITIVDKEPYHLFHANLYEVATGPEEVTSFESLKKTVAISVAEIVAGTKIKFIEGKVDSIHHDGKAVSIGGQKIPYDYLVVSGGSTNNYFNIPGAAEHSLALKTLPDAFRIRGSFEAIVQQASEEMAKRNIRFAIGGGGFTGVELAGELAGLLRMLSWKYNYPLEKMEILVVEGSNRVLPGLDDKIGRDVADRLRELGVRIQLNSMITEVTPQFLSFKNGEKLECDLLVWTAGVKAETIGCTKELELDKNSRVQTNEYLECTMMPDVFFIGDQAYIVDSQGRPLPGTARQGLHQAAFVAEQIFRLLHGQPKIKFVHKDFGYVVPVGGKWAAFKSGNWYLTGRLAYLLREIWELQYFASIVGWWKAFRIIRQSDELYSRND